MKAITAKAAWMFLFNLGILLYPGSASFSSENLGAFLGAKDTDHPSWFKESFLDFEEDIKEAASEGKRLVLYFWQTGCPYCNALVEQNFAQRDIVETMQSNYQLVGINMWGDSEVIQVGGKVFTEGNTEVKRLLPAGRFQSRNRLGARHQQLRSAVC